MSNENINLLIIKDNPFDDATLSASPAPVSSLPVENLKNPSRSKIMRTQSTDSQVINFDFSELKLLSGLAITRHTLPTTSKMRVELFQSAGQSGVKIYDSGEFDATETIGWGDFFWGQATWGQSIFQGWEKYHTVHIFDAVLVLSGRITVTNSAVFVADIGRVYLGAVLQPEFNCAWGVQFAWNEDTALTRTEGGTLRSDPKGVPFRSLQFNFSHLTPADRSQLSNLRRVLGNRKDFFVSVYPTMDGQLKTDHAMGCKLVNNDGFSHNSMSHFSNGFTLQEC
jgi:hypothetical protein